MAAPQPPPSAPAAGTAEEAGRIIARRRPWLQLRRPGRGPGSGPAPPQNGVSHSVTAAYMMSHRVSESSFRRSIASFRGRNVSSDARNGSSDARNASFRSGNAPSEPRNASSERPNASFRSRSDTFRTRSCSSHAWCAASVTSGTPLPRSGVASGAGIAFLRTAIVLTASSLAMLRSRLIVGRRRSASWEIAGATPPAGGGSLPASDASPEASDDVRQTRARPRGPLPRKRERPCGGSCHTHTQTNGQRGSTASTR